MTEYTPIHFLDEHIDVIFNEEPIHQKSPHCPNAFVWNEKTYQVIESLSEWPDFSRTGKMAQNMRPAHAEVASSRGSLNVGRFYFRVKAMSGSATAAQTIQIFDIYYDRAMKGVDKRKGEWFVYRELASS
jgi:hypothetical protein